MAFWHKYTRAFHGRDIPSVLPESRLYYFILGMRKLRGDFLTRHQLLWLLRWQGGNQKKKKVLMHFFFFCNTINRNIHKQTRKLFTRSFIKQIPLWRNWGDILPSSSFRRICQVLVAGTRGPNDLLHLSSWPLVTIIRFSLKKIPNCFHLQNWRIDLLLLLF